MKEKIKAALKNKYANLGFGDKAFDGVADYLTKTVEKEEDIETAASGVDVLLKAFQGDMDALRTEKAGLKRMYEELKAKGDTKEEPAKAEPEDIRKLIEEAVAKQVAPVQKELDGYRDREAKAARAGFISTKARELKISKERREEGFAIGEDWTEAQITDYLSKVRQNEVARGLEDKGSAFSMSTTEKQGNEAAAGYVDSLPDA